MKVCTIHQPQFLPWLGYLDKIYHADVFVFLDDVQFKKNEFQNRNRILVFGQPQWLTVPVSFSFGDTLRQVRIAETAKWVRKAWQTLEHNYHRTPFFTAYAPALHALLSQKWDNLAALNAATVLWLLECFEIKREILYSSAMCGLSNDPTGRLTEICQRTGAGAYLSGAGGRNYLQCEVFEREKLALIFQNYHHPVYPQKSTKASGTFVPYLSAVDALFNIGGGANAREVLFGEKQKEHNLS